jgi:hypothetical protein
MKVLVRRERFTCKALNGSIIHHCLFRAERRSRAIPGNGGGGTLPHLEGKAGGDKMKSPEKVMA